MTGGDALVKITGATAAPTVTVGGVDVSSAFKGDATKGWIGYVTGLKDGDNDAVSAKAGTDTANLTLVNRPLNGTLFAGPQQSPYLCETEGLKLGKALDANCAANTVVEYKYLSKTDNMWKAFDPKGTRPADIADTAVGANRVPDIARIERGVINRAGYVDHHAARPGCRPAQQLGNRQHQQGLERQADLRLRRRRAGELPPEPVDRPHRQQHRRAASWATTCSSRATRSPRARSTSSATTTTTSRRPRRRTR